MGIDCGPSKGHFISKENTYERPCTYPLRWKTSFDFSDASPYGIAAVLSHVDDDGVERLVGFKSRTLSITERNYAQIDNEALSFVFGVSK